MSSVQETVRRSSVVAAMTSLLAAAFLGGPVAAQGADGTTVVLADARSGHTATLLSGDRLLVAGGTDGESALASVEVIDSVGMSVAPLGSLGVARDGHSATLLPDGRILVAGGIADGVVLGEAELLDPATGLSESVGPMRSARVAHAAVLLDDGRVLLVGGLGSEKHASKAEIFEPATGSFVKAATPKAVHSGARATKLRDGRVLLTGPTTGKKTRAAEIYDPSRDKWTPVKGGGDRAGHSSTVLADDRVLLTGGAPRAEVFDPALGKFKRSGKSVPRGSHTATLLSDGRVLIAGGDDAGAIEVFDAEGKVFQPTGELPIPRSGLTATLMGDGRVLLVGGDFEGLALDDVLVLDPEAETLLPLGTDLKAAIAAFEAAVDTRQKSHVRAEHGSPEAFAIYYHDELADDGTAVAASIETWRYYTDGVEFTFADDRVVAEAGLDLEDGAVAEPAPYDPDSFDAYLALDEVVAAADLTDYIGGPVDEMVEGGELYFADRRTWGMKDGELRYIEALALEAEPPSPETE